jgi:Family of unknown function (DUF6174)
MRVPRGALAESRRRVVHKLFGDLVRGWFQRATLLVLVLAGTACSTGTGTQNPLEDARALWEKAGATSYTFELQPVCFCAVTANARVTVENGVVTSVFDLAEQRLMKAQDAELYLTVDALFDLLEDAQSRNAYSIRVEYDPVLGFPTDFFIDYRENTADEELGYRAGGLIIA